MKNHYIKKLKKGWIPNLNTFLYVEWDDDKKKYLENVLNKELFEAIEEVYSPIYYRFTHGLENKHIVFKQIFENPNFVKIVYDELGISIDRVNYNKKPIRERKDNLNPLTETRNYGNGYSFKGKLRVPSKKHKNRYKNFLKLFPNFKSK